MGERLEVIKRVFWYFIYGIVAEAVSTVAFVLAFLNWIYTLIFGKRLKSSSGIGNKVSAYVYRWTRYLFFAAAKAPGLVDFSEKDPVDMEFEGNERVEALIRIPMLILYEIVSGVVGFVLMILWPFHALYVLVLGKRHAGFAGFAQKFVSYVYKVNRYILFATSKRVGLLDFEPIEEPEL